MIYAVGTVHSLEVMSLSTRAGSGRAAESENCSKLLLFWGFGGELGLMED